VRAEDDTEDRGDGCFSEVHFLLEKGREHAKDDGEAAEEGVREMGRGHLEWVKPGVSAFVDRHGDYWMVEGV
jgi:hypothetical protein